MSDTCIPRAHFVVLTGAGISAESGLKTFRGADGLWEGERVEEVATPQAWFANKEKVLRFYNLRREQLETVEPNRAHRELVKLEKQFKVTIITQNVDDLHERAGSSNVIHLHGQLTQVRSTFDEHLVYDWGYKPLTLEDKCEKGSQLRPHIVWFGESVPEYENAAQITQTADYLLVVGTSLLVYPAAGLIHEVSPQTVKAIVNPDEPEGVREWGFQHLACNATEGVPDIVRQWMKP